MFCRRHMTMNAPGILADYPDIFAVFIIISLTGEQLWETTVLSLSSFQLSFLTLSVVICSQDCLYLE